MSFQALIHQVDLLATVFTKVINYDKRIDPYQSSNQEIKLISSLISGSDKFEPLSTPPCQ